MQGFSDVRPEWDIFNNLNLSFWEVRIGNEMSIDTCLPSTSVAFWVW
jgi:hypothetical protein